MTGSAIRAIVAFPHLQPDDRHWLESIREKHDPQAKVIAAHFTLVFPSVLPPRTTESHVARIAQAAEPVRFVLRRAAVVADAHGAGGHVFLIPEEGRDGLTQLHNRLHDGPFVSLRPSSTFTPHVTIAAKTPVAPLHLLAAGLNAKAINMRGSISELVLVEVTASAIEMVAHFQLGG